MWSIRCCPNRNRARVVADTDSGAPEVVPTADFGYVRLRRFGYAVSDPEGWLSRLVRRPWRRAYVYFKHEDEGSEPEDARWMRDLWGARETA